MALNSWPSWANSSFPSVGTGFEKSPDPSRRAAERNRPTWLCREREAASAKASATRMKPARATLVSTRARPVRPASAARSANTATRTGEPNPGAANDATRYSRPPSVRLPLTGIVVRGVTSAPASAGSVERSVRPWRWMSSTAPLARVSRASRAAGSEEARTVAVLAPPRKRRRCCAGASASGSPTAARVRPFSVTTIRARRSRDSSARAARVVRARLSAAIPAATAGSRATLAAARDASVVSERKISRTVEATAAARASALPACESLMRRNTRTPKPVIVSSTITVKDRVSRERKLMSGPGSAATARNRSRS